MTLIPFEPLGEWQFTQQSRPFNQYVALRLIRPCIRSGSSARTDGLGSGNSRSQSGRTSVMAPSRIGWYEKRTPQSGRPDGRSARITMAHHRAGRRGIMTAPGKSMPRQRTGMYLNDPEPTCDRVPSCKRSSHNSSPTQGAGSKRSRLLARLLQTLRRKIVGAPCATRLGQITPDTMRRSRCGRQVRCRREGFIDHPLGQGFHANQPSLPASTPAPARGWSWSSG